MYYLYRFLNEESEIIYVGETGRSMEERMTDHFSGRGHLPKECYEEVFKVEYVTLSSFAEMDIRETYYINLWKPKWNTSKKKDEELNMGFNIPELNWSEYSAPSRMKHAPSQEKVSVRISFDAYESMDYYCKLTKMSKKKYVIKAIEAFFSQGEEKCKKDLSRFNRDRDMCGKKAITINPTKILRTKMWRFAISNKLALGDIANKSVEMMNSQVFENINKLQDITV